MIITSKTFKLPIPEKYTKIFLGLLLFYTLIVTGGAYCQEERPKQKIALLTSGGDQEEFIDDWREKNLELVSTKLTTMGFTCNPPILDKNSFETQLKKAVRQLNCGDELFLYFNGHHGSVENHDKSITYKGFLFDNETEEADKWLSPDEILEWLNSLNCCVKVFIATYACYSGLFHNKLQRDEHVVLTCSATSEDETAGKIGIKDDRYLGDYVTRKNWANGFVNGLHEGGSLVEAIIRAAESAKVRAENRSFQDREGHVKIVRNEHPQIFMRGHVEKVAGRNITLKVGNDTVDIVNSHTIIKFGSNNIILKYCFDVEAYGQAKFFGETNKFIPERIDVFKKKIIAKIHVLDVKDLKDNKVKVHFVKPDVFYCDHRIVKLENPFPEDIKFCKWYDCEIENDGENIYARNLVACDPEPYEFIGHISNIVDQENGIFILDIEKPDHLKGRRTINLKEGEELPEWVKTCLKVGFTGILIDNEVKEVTSIEVVLESFTGHVIKVDKENGIVEIDQITRPERYKNQTKRMIDVDLKNIKDLDSCNWIFFRGKCYGEEIRECGPISTGNKPRDAGANRITSPQGYLCKHESMDPSIIVSNNSAIQVDFAVDCSIYNIYDSVIYRETLNVTMLGPNEEKELKFPTWFSGSVESNNKVYFKTNLIDDENPDNDMLSAQFNVISCNKSPFISNPTVIPDSGYSVQIFQFNVTYTDPEGDYPILKEIVIDNTSYTLNIVDGDPISGLLLQYQAQLAVGSHTYKFKFDDGHGNLIETQQYDGPLVKY